MSLRSILFVGLGAGARALAGYCRQRKKHEKLAATIKEHQKEHDKDNFLYN
jgi:hypothetical protein